MSSYHSSDQIFSDYSLEHMLSAHSPDAKIGFSVQDFPSYSVSKYRELTHSSISSIVERISLIIDALHADPNTHQVPYSTIPTDQETEHFARADGKVAVLTSLTAGWSTGVPGRFKATALFDPFTVHAVLAHSRSAAFSICRSRIGAWDEFAAPGRPKPKEWGPHRDAVEGLVVVWMKPGEIFTILNRMGGPEYIILHKGWSLGPLFSRELLFKGINIGRVWVNRYFWGRA